MKKGLIILILVVISLWIGFLTYEINNLKPNIENEVVEYNVTGFSTDLTQVIENNKSSVVTIKTTDKISTGFIYDKVDDKLYVVTTLHGVSNTEDITVTLHSGLKLAGNLKAYDIYLDLALIECTINNEVVPVTIGDSDLLKDGVFVVGIGTAGLEEYNFSSQFGMVSSKYREIENNISFNNETYHCYAGYIQLSGEFVEGYSGSPIFNMNGEVVGMIEQKDDSAVLAATINEIKFVVDKMIAGEEYHRFNYGFSGKFIEDLENYEKSHLNINLETIEGYYIENVKVGSFANNIGLVKGDVILDINGIAIKNHDSMLHAMYDGFENYSLTIVRNNEKLKLEGLIND